jgi:Na+/H+ antiporter NhaA
MSERQAPLSSQSEHAARPGLVTPLRSLLSSGQGSAVILLAATLAALVWANLDSPSYESFWGTRMSLRAGDSQVSLDLRGWVNSGLMTLFFMVVGLEARHELDMGDLRERRRIALPLLAGIGGMVVPVAIYLLVNAGHPTAGGWGAVMSTDTAFALGVIALVGPRFPARLRNFMVTVTVVDDLVALAVIALVYSGTPRLPGISVALALFAVLLAIRAADVRSGPVYALLGIAMWVATLKAGVDPIVVGLALGLLAYAYPAARSDLEHASRAFRLFREQPTASLARSAQIGLVSALSPNERLRERLEPWTNRVIVPVFALANAGIVIDAGLLSRALTSTVALGIFFGYVLGKPIGITGTSWLVTVLSRGRLHPPVGWAAVAAGGTIAGIGFTVSLLVSSLAFQGDRLEEAKLGVLSAALCATAVTWVIYRVTALLPRHVRTRALLGRAQSLIDLAVSVDVERDHIRGPVDAPVTLVEYGDFECPYCGRAERVLQELLENVVDIRYVWRHLPLNDVHPHAQLAAEAAEAAAAQGAFWPMHDRLLQHQDSLRGPDLIRHAEALGLDVERFRHNLHSRSGAERIAEDVDSADLSGVSGTPSFFINGRRHHGAYDPATLTDVVLAAGAHLDTRE